MKQKNQVEEVKVTAQSILEEVKQILGEKLFNEIINKK